MRSLLLPIVVCCVARGTGSESGTEEVEGFVGESLRLECRRHNGTTYTWRDPDQNLILRKTPEGIQRGPLWPKRKATLVDRHGGTLRIKSLNISRDNGDFTCKSSGKVVKVSVNVFARITDVSIKEAKNGVITVSSGKSFRFTCDVRGNPNPLPTYKWTIAGTTTKNYYVPYYVLWVDRSLNGKVLRCMATNRRPNKTIISSESSSAVINVLYVDSPTVPEPTVSVNETKDVTLRCSAEGNPPPIYQWTRSGSSDVISTSANFTIVSVERSAAGEYVCQVINSEGTRNATVTLIVGNGTAGQLDTADRSSHSLVAYVAGGVVAGLLLVVGALVTAVLRVKSRGCWAKTTVDEVNLGYGDVSCPGSGLAHVRPENSNAALPTDHVNTDAADQVDPADNTYESLRGLNNSPTEGRAYLSVFSGVPPSSSDSDTTAQTYMNEGYENVEPKADRVDQSADNSFVASYSGRPTMYTDTESGIYHHYEEILPSPTADNNTNLKGWEK